MALPHEVVTVVGRTGSGKTRLIAKALGPRHARRITLDSMGECEDLYPDAHRVFTLEEAYNAMNAWAQQGVTTWHLVAALDESSVGLLMAKLAPQYDGKTESLSSALGGVCVECFEIDLYLPVSGAGGQVTRAFQHAVARGRHVGLSLLCATQRPAQCHRILTSQSQYVVSFSMHEPGDIRWLQSVGGVKFARIAHHGLKRYHSVWYSALSHSVTVRDPNYKEVRTESNLFPDDNAGRVK